MSDPSRREPPRQVWYELDEALALLADLEDARDALITSDRLGVVVTIENQIRILSRKLEFDDWPGTKRRLTRCEPPRRRDAWVSPLERSSDSSTSASSAT